MNCVILQPSYIPWRGYFHQIQKADVFVFYDDVQYDKNGWRNRNRIKTHNGPIWLTIPVLHQGSISENISVKDMRIDWSKDWQRKHWISIQQSYAKSPYFGLYAPLLEKHFRIHSDYLADFTIELTIDLARASGIENTHFIRSSSLGITGAKTDRLIAILTKLGANHYISGPAARDYLDTDKMNAAGINVEWMVYNYPEYEQLYPPFDPQISIIDLLFMTGPQAGQFIWGSG